MKRHLLASTLTLAALAITITGCSAPGTGGEASGGTSSSDTKVAFVSQIEGIPYFTGFKAGAEKAAAKFGVAYTQAGPATADAAEQKRIVDGLVSQGFKAIAVSPLDPTSMNGSIASATKSGVAVITSDADAPKSDRQVFVSQASDEALGATVLDQIAEQMNGKGEYAIVSGAPDASTFNAWTQAAQDEAAKKYPEMKLVGGIRHTTDSAGALSEAQNLITAFPNLKGIIAVPSTAVPGVAQAVQNANKVGEIAVSGFGSPKTVAQYIKSGVMKSSVLWNVEDLGYLTVWAEKQVIDKKDFAASNDVPGLSEPVKYDAASKILLLGKPTVFTKENVDKFDF